MSDSLSKKYCFAVITDGYRVLESGVVVLPKKYGTVDFLFNDGQGESRIRLKFVEGTGESSFTIEDRSEHHVSFLCKGFDDALGATLAAPIEIMEMSGRLIFFKFIAFDMKSVPYLAYTFYEREGQKTAYRDNS